MKDHSERLTYLVNKFPEIKEKYDKYKQLCEERAMEPIDFLTNAKHYESAETLGVSTITYEIEKLIHKMEPPASQKSAKVSKSEVVQTKKCAQCNGSDFLGISSRACDGHYWTLPSGKNGEGYLPNFPALGDLGGDGASFEICVDCGHIVGFDSAALKNFIKELESGDDNDNIDDNIDDDDDDDDE